MRTRPPRAPDTTVGGRAVNPSGSPYPPAAISQAPPPPLPKAQPHKLRILPRISSSTITLRCASMSATVQPDAGRSFTPCMIDRA